MNQPYFNILYDLKLKKLNKVIIEIPKAVQRAAQEIFNVLDDEQKIDTLDEEDETRINEIIEEYKPAQTSKIKIKVLQDKIKNIFNSFCEKRGILNNRYKRIWINPEFVSIDPVLFSSFVDQSVKLASVLCGHQIDDEKSAEEFMQKCKIKITILKRPFNFLSLYVCISVKEDKTYKKAWGHMLLPPTSWVVYPLMN